MLPDPPGARLSSLNDPHTHPRSHRLILDTEHAACALAGKQPDIGDTPARRRWLPHAVQC
jgi:hypothetical protein